MLFFHAFTGCDVVSGFRVKGKKSAWQTWNVCDEASGVFSKLSHYPPVVAYEDVDILEKFVVMMYSMTDPAQLKMLMRRGWTCLLGSRGHTKPFLQPDQH